MLIGILLFPPFEIEGKNYKFFDFVFNSEYVIKRIDGEYNYTVDSRERKITKIDTSDAINFEYEHKVDTFYNYTQIKDYKNIKVKSKNNSNYGAAGFRSWLDFYLKYRDDSEYFKKEISKIDRYTITHILKPRYLSGYRKLLVSQLVIEIIVVVLLVSIITSILMLKNIRRTK
jgi:hypothetical protein